MKKRSRRIISLIIGLVLVFSATISASAESSNIAISEELVSENSVMVGSITYDDGMAYGDPREYCKVKTTKIIWVKGDMKGQPLQGTDLSDGEGMMYVVDDKNTKRSESVSISLGIEGSVAVASSKITANVTVPVNIFKRNGTSVTGDKSVIRIAKKDGCYKLYGKVKYRIITYRTFWRTDSRKLSPEQQKKNKWKYLTKYKKDSITVLKDSSYLRYIGKIGTN